MKNSTVRRGLLKNLLLELPLSLIICATAFYYVWSSFLSPKIDPNAIRSAGAQLSDVYPIAIIGLGIITPLCYVLWFSFCLMLLLARLDVITQFKILFFELSKVLACFVPIMWLWFWVASAIFQLKRAFKSIIDSAIALEAWGLLGIFAALLLLMVATFLKAYLLMLYRIDEEQETAQDRAQYFKNKFLCFVTVVFTAVVIVYI